MGPRGWAVTLGPCGRGVVVGAMLVDPRGWGVAVEALVLGGWERHPSFIWGVAFRLSSFVGAPAEHCARTMNPTADGCSAL